MEIDLEVPRVQDHTLRSMKGGGKRLGHRVGDRYELNIAGPDSPTLAVADGNPGDLTGQSGLVHPVPGQTQSELGTVDVHRKITEQKRQPASVIFVSVGQDDRVHPIRSEEHTSELQSLRH